MDAVEWLQKFGAALDDLNGKTVSVKAARTKPSQAEIDAIHEGLLKKQRSGSLGLND